MSTVAEHLANRLTSEKDPDRFQRFAARFAEVYKPNIFENINYFSGMNTRYQAIGGHPDSWRFYDGGVACIEASTIEPEGIKGKVRDDMEGLAKEIIKCNRKATYALIIHSSLCDRIPSDCAELEHDLRQYVMTNLDIDSNHVEIILGYNLISILIGSPKYGPLLREFFGINTMNGPFHPMENDIRLTHRSYQFPTANDISTGKIYIEPEFTDRCIKSLDSKNKVLLKGRSGSGKSVLSFILGFHYLKRNYDCLFVDLRLKTDFRMKDFISFTGDHGHQKQLLVIDNAHLCPELISEYNDLRAIQSATGFKTLFITPLFPKKPSAAAEPTIEDMLLTDGGEIITLLAGPAALKSLFAYYGENGANKLTDDELLSVYEKYGADMYLLAFALCNLKQEALARETAAIDSQAFGEAVYKRFIECSISTPENILNLAILASFSTFDIPAPRTVFNTESTLTPIFIAEKKIGHVHETKTGSFVLSHSALGFIILREYCRRERKDIISVLHNNLVRAPHVMPILAEGLFEQDRISTNDIVRALFTDKAYLQSALSAGAILSTRHIALIDRSCHSFSRDYNDLIRTDPKTFARALAASDLISLSNFLFSSFRDKPEEFTKLIPELNRNSDLILKQLGKTAPHTVKDVLNKLERIAANKNLSTLDGGEIKKLRCLLVDEVAKVGEQFRFFSLCTRSKFSLGYLVSLLDYLRQEKTGFHDAVLASITSKSNLQRLVDRGLGAPLDHFVNFLEYAQIHCNFETGILLSELSKDPRIKSVVERFYSSPFDLTFSYLLYWNQQKTNETISYTQNLLSNIFNSSNAGRLLTKLRQTSVQHLCSFFSSIHTLGVSDEILPKELLEPTTTSSIWEESCRTTTPQFISFLDRLKSIGGLAAAISENLLVQSTAKRRTGKQIGYRSVEELVSYLGRIAAESKGAKIAFKQEFNRMNDKDVFHKAVEFMLIRATQRPYSTSHLIGNCNLRRIWKLIVLMKECDNDILFELLKLLRNKLFAFIQEPLDHVNDFLQKLDSSGNDLMVSTGVHIRTALSSDDYIDSFVLRILSTGVGYLANFFRSNFKEHRAFVLALVHRIESKHYDKLLETCANARPNEFVAFLKFIDLRRKNEIWLSGGLILSDLFNSHAKVFKASIQRATQEQQTSLTHFLGERYQRFLEKLHQTE